jgi:AcrR family transcriptional regulator
MEEIGWEADVSKATVHLYFGSKERLFTEAVRSAMEPLMKLGELKVVEWKGSMSSLLRELVQAWRDITSTHPAGELLKLMITEGPAFPALAQQADTLIGQAHAVVTNLLERGIRNGEFRPCDAAMTAHVLLASLGFHEICRYSNGAFGKTAEPDDAFFSTYLDFVLNGLSSALSKTGVREEAGRKDGRQARRSRFRCNKAHLVKAPI